MKNVTLLLATLIISTTAVVITSLSSSVPGKLVLAFIAAWVAANIFGIEINAENVKNDPWFFLEGLF